MRSPFRHLFVLFVLLPLAFLHVQCTKKKDSRGNYKPNAAAAAAYAAGFKKQQADNLEGAIIEFTKAIDADPMFTSAYRSRGDAKRDNGDNEGAIVDYTKVIGLNPKDGVATYNRGVVRTKTGDMDGALADFSKTIELDPRSSSAYSGRGDVRKSQGDFAGAIEDYSKAIEFAPEEGTAYRSRGAAKFEQGDNEGAIADFTKSIELDPKISATFQARGLAYASAGEWKKAAADFDKAYVAAPSNVSFALYRWVAQTRAGLDGTPKLSAAFRRAREGRSGADDWAARIALFILGDMDEQALMVMADSGGAEKARNQTCQAACYLGFWHLTTDKKDEAIAAFQKSVATDRKSLVEYRLAKDELARLEGKK
jgi:tetratricopeptide (TPR) repeat protein